MGGNMKRTVVACILILLVASCKEQLPATVSPSATIPKASRTATSGRHVMQTLAPSETMPSYPYPKPVYVAPTPRAYPPPALTETAVAWTQMFRAMATTMAAPRRTKVIPQTPTPASNSSSTISKPLACRNRGDGTQRCVDEVLNITFDVPVKWGDLRGGLQRSNYRGWAYGIGSVTGNIPFDLRMGGRSHDFGEQRGAIETDFRGFGYGIESWVCEENEDRYSWCEWITEDRILMAWEFPKAEMACSYEMDGFGIPRVWVVVDLPENALINGFVFLANFLSQEDVHRLDGALNKPDQLAPPECTPNRMANYNRVVSDLARQVKRGEIDDESQEILGTMKAIAESIHFR